MFSEGTIIECVNKGGTMSWGGTGFTIKKGETFYARIDGKKSHILFMRNRLGYKDYLVSVLTVPTKSLYEPLNYKIKIAPIHDVNGL